jgi:RNA polymerase sigma-70 factor (ECF subfamily)
MDHGASSYRRFLQGDDSGFEEIVRTYSDGLILYLYGYVSDFHLAEDLCEDTFFRLLVKKPRFDGRSSFKSWLYTIGKNLATDHLRRAKRYQTAEYEGDYPDGDTPERKLLKEEQRVQLYRALQTLKTEYRCALYLLYFEGFDMEQTAKHLGKTKHQTETLVWRAKNALKGKLEEEGFVYEEP